MPRAPRKLDPVRVAAEHGRPPAVAATLIGLGPEAELLDLELGPLKFAAPVGPVAEAVGDGLEAVGGSVVSAERRPRAVKLQLPVRGVSLVNDPGIEGRRLRRQLRQLMNNAQLRLQGVYLVWEQDPELDGWLQIGAGELAETDPGISFGEFQLELADVFRAGYPGTHRPGKRMMLTDRRNGLWPLDTRGLLYSADFATTTSELSFPLQLPAGLTGPARSSLLKVATSNGHQPPGSVPRLWRSYAAVDGEVITYDPDITVWPARSRYIDAEDWGSVRVWDLSGAATYPPVVSGYTEAHDFDPTGYGWERVYGDLLTPDAPVAIDNGFCRLIWLGSEPSQGLAIESWKNATSKYQRVGRVLTAGPEFGTPAVSKAKIVELTGERAVVEWRAGPFALRAILQRGWRGPRLEAYYDNAEEGDEVSLEYLPTSAEEKTATVAATTVPWIQKISGTGGPFVYWAQGCADEVNSGASIITPMAGGAVAGTRFHRHRVIVAQLVCEGESPEVTVGFVAALALTDAQAVPVLVSR